MSSNINIDPKIFEPLSIFFAGALTWFGIEDGLQVLLQQRIQVFCATDLEAAIQIATESIMFAFLNDKEQEGLPTLATVVMIPLEKYITAIVKGETFYEDQPVTEINLAQLLHNRGQ